MDDNHPELAHHLLATPSPFWRPVAEIREPRLTGFTQKAQHFRRGFNIRSFHVPMTKTRIYIFPKSLIIQATYRRSLLVLMLAVIITVSIAILSCNPTSPSSDSFEPWGIYMQFRGTFSAVVSHAERKAGSSTWSPEVIGDTVVMRAEAHCFGNPKKIQREADGRTSFFGSVTTSSVSGIINSNMQSVDTAGGDRWWFFNNTATDAQINFKCAAINLPLVQHADTILSGYPSNELSIYEITGSAVKERVTSVSWDSTFMTLNPVNLADHRVTYKLLELQRDDSAYLRVIFTFNPRSPSNKRVGFLPLGNMAERRTP